MLGEDALSGPAEQLFQALDERLVGRAGLRGAGTDQHYRSPAVQGGGDLLDEPGFTRPWFAADEDQLTCAGADDGPALLGHCRLRRAADKDRLCPSGGAGRKRRSIPHPHLPTLAPVGGTVDSQNWLGARRGPVSSLVMTGWTAAPSVGSGPAGGCPLPTGTYTKIRGGMT